MNVRELDCRVAIEPFLEYYAQNKEKGRLRQLSLSHRPGRPPYEDGCGMAYSLETQQKTFDESEFTELNQDLSAPMREELARIESVSQTQFGARLGRIRLMNLGFKSCLSYHQDYDDFRFHVPLITNPKCFFIVDEQLYRMPQTGTLYYLNTKVLHAAVNASFCYDRLHLVCGTFPISRA